MSRHMPVIVIGGGQAGLSVSCLLKQEGIEHLVLERHGVGYSWRERRWDTFCLVTPNWQCRLPGHAYAGDDPNGFMKKDQIVGYLESYARSFDPPLLCGVTVRALSACGSEGRSPRFELDTSHGRFTAGEVVVATGSYHIPQFPKQAESLPSDIATLHSDAYKNPKELPDGDVLVVGTGQSGCQIAEDLHLAGRRVHLSVGPAPRCARRYRGRDVVEWLDSMGYYDIPFEDHPNKEQVREKTNHYVTGRDGGRDIDLRRRALEGMCLYGPLRGIERDRFWFSPELTQNLDAADAVYEKINRSIDAFIRTNGIEAPEEALYVPPWGPRAEPESLGFRDVKLGAVIFCTGYRADFDWVNLPVLDARGFPRHERGVSDFTGLYFIGLPWLYTWGSGRFSGVGRDAAHLVSTIRSRRASEERSRGADPAALGRA